jgi:hypothetical protein
MHIWPPQVDLFTMAGKLLGPLAPVRYFAGRVRPHVGAQA